MTEQELSDVKVLDLTEYVAGPYCTKMLADYGADVIKVERPSAGDPTRRMAPFPGDEPHLEKSGTFLLLNTNKKGITLNLASETGRKIFKGLVKDADILVESFKPGTMEELGLGWEELERINPNLVMTRITPFGQTGPYKKYEATDIVLMAMGFPMYVMRMPDREPLKYYGNVALFGCGNYAAAATMVGLWVAEQQGIGQVIDFSCIEAMHSSTNWMQDLHTSYTFTGRISEPIYLGIGAMPNGGYPCEDGYVYMIIEPEWWKKFVEMIEMPDLLERFPTIIELLDPSKREEIDTAVIPWLMERTKLELHELAGSKKINLSAVNTMEDVFNDRHLRERGAFVEIDHPVAGKFTYPGRPLVMPEAGWDLRMPAPLLGQHNEEIYGGLGYTKGDMVKLREGGVI